MIQQDLPKVGGARQGLQAVAAGGDIVFEGAVNVRFQDVVGPSGVTRRKKRKVADAADATAAHIAGQARTVQQPIQRGLRCKTHSAAWMRSFHMRSSSLLRRSPKTTSTSLEHRVIRKSR